MESKNSRNVESRTKQTITVVYFGGTENGKLLNCIDLETCIPPMIGICKVVEQKMVHFAVVSRLLLAVEGDGDEDTGMWEVFFLL